MTVHRRYHDDGEPVELSDEEQGEKAWQDERNWYAWAPGMVSYWEIEGEEEEYDELDEDKVEDDVLQDEELR